MDGAGSRKGWTAAALAACSLLAFVGALAPAGPGAWAAAAGAALFPVLLIAFAAGPSRAPRPALAVLGALLALGTGGVLALGARPEASKPLLGLSPAAWLMLGGLGLVPLALVAWIHAAAFPPRDGSG